MRADAFASTSCARPVAQHTASSARRRGPARAARVVATAVTSPIQPSPDVVDASRAASSAACTVACFARKDALSFMRYPKSLAARGRFDVEGPSFGEVFEHLARRVAWSDADEGTLRMIVVDVDASDEEMRASGASDADVFIAIDVDDEETAGRVRRATASAATGCALNSPALEADERICYQPTRQLRAVGAKLTPWSQAAKDVRLMDQVKELYARGNHLDTLLSILLLVDASGARVPAVDINQDITLGNVWCIASNCNKQLLACYQNPQCKKSLDCVDACGLNDQVCTYTCIRGDATAVGRAVAPGKRGANGIE